VYLFGDNNTTNYINRTTTTTSLRVLEEIETKEYNSTYSTLNKFQRRSHLIDHRYIENKSHFFVIPQQTIIF